MKKTLYLHIGFGKTGTTSIQNHLNSQRESLSNSGILYPLAGQLNSGHHLLAVLGNNEIQEATLSEYRKLLIEINSSTCQKIILSSENYCFMSKHYVAHIKDIFSSLETKIIFYARPQTELIESTYLEWIKTGKKYTRTIDEFFKAHSHGFDFIERLEPWRLAFGEENIILRRYSSHTKSCDSRADILQTIQAPEHLIKNISKTVSQDSNPSLSPDLIELIYKIDKLQPQASLRWEIITEILNLTARLDFKKPQQLTSESLSREIAEFYKKSNDELIKKYETRANHV